MSPHPQASIPNSEFDALVRRVDEDRWLATRFAPADVRKRLIAVYALNYEIARAAETVSEATLGDIRLEWWRAAIADIHAGKSTRAHPALEAYARAQSETPFSNGVAEALIEARRKDLDPQPFATRLEFDDYIAATAGGVMWLAIEACGGARANGAADRFVHQCAWLWGVTGLLRSEPVWRAKGRDVLPPDRDRLLSDAEGVHRELRMAPPLASALFPAFGYITLAPGYLRGLKRGHANQPLLARQLKLIAASATGRV